MLDDTRRIQSEFRDFIDRQIWHSPHAVTLTFKKGRGVDGGRGTGIQMLTRDDASTNMRHFLNRLDRHTFGHSAFRFGQRVQAVPVIEGGNGKGLHYHLILDCPRDELKEGYTDLLQSLWQKTDWGHKMIHVEADSDSGWTKYVVKLRDKPEYADCIDWNNCYVLNR